jgi:mannose-6-phosphate isomerase-like protein (cupin superfamily)
MKGFVKDIESIAVKNEEFRRVLYTAKNCQLVVMALKPQEEIGAEVHTLDQFFRVEEGTGEAILDGARTAIQAGFAVIVAARGSIRERPPVSRRRDGLTARRGSSRASGRAERT